MDTVARCPTQDDRLSHQFQGDPPEKTLVACVICYTKHHFCQKTELTFARQPPSSYKSHTFFLPFESVALLSGHSLTCPLVFPTLLTLGQLQRLISRGRGRRHSLGLGISVLPRTGTIPCKESGAVETAAF